MSLPKSVNVLGKKIKISHKIPVKYKSEINKDNYLGLFFSELGQIWINDKCDDKTMNAILIHEICHAVLSRVGADLVISSEMNEVVCESMANFFSDHVDFNI